MAVAVSGNLHGYTREATAWLTHPSKVTTGSRGYAPTLTVGRAPGALGDQIGSASLPGELVAGVDAAIGRVHGHERRLVRGVRGHAQFGVHVQVPDHAARRED